MTALFIRRPVLAIVVNLVVDLLYRVLDPRTRAS